MPAVYGLPPRRATGRFEARFSSPQPISSSGTSDLPFTVLTDPDHAWDPVHHWYTVPAAGRYIACLYTTLNSDNGGRLITSVYHGPTEYRGSDIIGGGTNNYAGGEAVAIIQASAGDNIKPQVYYSGSARSLDVSTWFAVTQIPG